MASGAPEHDHPGATPDPAGPAGKEHARTEGFAARFPADPTAPGDVHDRGVESICIGEAR